MLHDSTEFENFCIIDKAIEMYRVLDYTIDIVSLVVHHASYWEKHPFCQEMYDADYDIAMNFMYDYAKDHIHHSFGDIVNQCKFAGVSLLRRSQPILITFENIEDAINTTIASGRIECTY